MKLLDLFSGIGGFSLAASWLGWETVQFVEIDKFCQKALNKHWPNVPIHSDIKDFDGTRFRNTIDIISGGFPCQPYSAAGKRLGTTDDRHLWPEMLRIISEVHPGWVVGENVRGLTNWNGGMVFDQVQADLETEGYEVLPFLLPACAVNAPHRRDRIWFVAYNSNAGIEKMRRRENSIHGFGASPNANSNGHESWRLRENRSAEGTGESEQKERERVWSNNRRIGESGNVTNSKKQRFPEWNAEQTWDNAHATTERHNGVSSWHNFPTQSPICDRNDGIPDRLAGITFPKWRNESIKALGNSIVPQVVYQIFKAINEYELTLNNNHK